MYPLGHIVSEISSTMSRDLAGVELMSRRADVAARMADRRMLVGM